MHFGRVVKGRLNLFALFLFCSSWVWAQPPCTKNLRLLKKNVLLAYSGGPDAAALAVRLIKEGAHPIPVYIDYRKSKGGKTSKDIKFAEQSAAIMGLPQLVIIESPLGERPKSERNRHIIESLAAIRDAYNADIVGLGTFREIHEASGLWKEESNDDIDPRILNEVGKANKVRVITWDSFGVNTKAAEFKGLRGKLKAAVCETTSCQMWWVIECGNCYSCRERHAAFTEAFGKDPTKYRPNSAVGKLQREAD